MISAPSDFAERYGAMQALGLMYMSQKAVVLSSAHGPELIADIARASARPTEQQILSEAAWVILSVGLSARSVSVVHHRLGACFYQWSSAKQLVAHQDECRQVALTTFRHEKKINAILRFAERLFLTGVARFLRELQEGSATDALPYFGPASTQHLRLNLGIATVKPDRHLKRLAASYSCDVATMCRLIAAYTGDGLRMVDRVLWTYASQYSTKSMPA